MKYKNSDCGCGGVPRCFWSNDSNYRDYLRKCHKLSTSKDIIIKQGFILKSASRDQLMEAEIDIDGAVNREIESATKEMQSFINDSIQNVEILEIQSDSGPMSSVLIHEELKSETENLFDKLADSMELFTKKVYQKIYILSAQSINEATESSGGLSSIPNAEKELLDRVDLWVKNLKKQILDKIDSEIDDLYLETKGYVQKGFVGDFFNGVGSFFKGIGDKIGKMVRNVVNWTKTVVKKTTMWFKGVERYEIVFSGGDNACETCQEMAGEVFDRDELNIGETAPPFHPNCRCKILPYVDDVGESDEEERQAIPDNVKEYVSLSQLKDVGFKNTTDSMIKELNQMLEKYDIITKEQVAHFLAQCLVESWNGNGLTEISNWKNPSDHSRDREYFNEKYGDNRNLGNLGRNTGDGYRFRGAGYIHLTGRYNYQKFADAMDDQNIMQGADYVAENYAWEAATWYWQNKVQHRFNNGKHPTVSQVTYSVNGGQNDLERRINAYNLASKIL